MAAPSLVAADMLPRFLLPRLSWGAPRAAARCAAAVGPSWPPPAPAPLPARSRALHLGQAPGRRRAAARESPVLRRALHATAPRPRDHHFDTLKFVKRLQSEGFTEEQSVAMMKVLNDVIEER